MTTILIVNDQPYLQKLFSQELIDEGFIVTAQDSYVGDPRLSQAERYVIKSFVAREWIQAKDS